MGIFIWFAAGSKGNEINKAIGVSNDFSGLFIAMIIFMLIFCVCGIGLFLINCDMKNVKWNLVKLPFTCWGIFVFLFFFSVGGALFGVQTTALNIVNDVCNGTSSSTLNSKEKGLKNFFSSVYT